MRFKHLIFPQCFLSHSTSPEKNAPPRSKGVCRKVGREYLDIALAGQFLIIAELAARKEV